MGARRGRRGGDHPGVGWRDGDQLVAYDRWPLPQICVFCGSQAVVATKGLIADARKINLPPVNLRSIAVPLCAEHGQSVKRARVGSFVAFAVSAVVLIAAWIRSARQGYGPPFPFTFFTVRGLLFIAVAYALGYLARKLYRSWYGVPKPLVLTYIRSGGGYFWLGGADPRFLSQLPSV